MACAGTWGYSSPSPPVQDFMVPIVECCEILVGPFLLPVDVLLRPLSGPPQAQTYSEE